MTESPNLTDARVGSVIHDRYKILDVIASGGMGIVYRGERLQLGRSVAIKFLHPWVAAQKSFLERFELEARAMSRLNHPNCVSVIDFGLDEDHSWSWTSWPGAACASSSRAVVSSQPARSALSARS